MSDTHLCSGCDTTFSMRGYQSHLLQTRDPLCRAVFEGLTGNKTSQTSQLLEQAAANSSDKAVEDNDDNFQVDVNMEGDLAEENRNFQVEEGLQLDDEENHEDDSEFEDIGDMDVEWTGWEQPRDGAPQEDARENEPADIRSDVDTSTRSNHEEESGSDNDHLQQKLDCFIIGDGYGVKPAVRVLYTDKYPSSRAGKPLSHEISRDSVYNTSLGGGDNPWAPFHSKKDWEVARWAKLRGVGSTAFSDFLAIDGVSFRNLLSMIIPLKFTFKRFATPSICHTRTRKN